MRAVKPRRWFVQRDIQALIRTFPCEPITVERGVRVYNTRLGTSSWSFAPVYRGEALVVPTSGAVEDYGLGQVENQNPRLLISGNWDIRQGDFVDYRSIRYQVKFPPNHWHAFLLIQMESYQQTRV